MEAKYVPLEPTDEQIADVLLKIVGVSSPTIIRAYRVATSMIDNQREAAHLAYRWADNGLFDD